MVDSPAKKIDCLEGNPKIMLNSSCFSRKPIVLRYAKFDKHPYGPHAVLSFYARINARAKCAE